MSRFCRLWRHSNGRHTSCERARSTLHQLRPRLLAAADVAADAAATATPPLRLLNLLEDGGERRVQQRAEISTACNSTWPQFSDIMATAAAAASTAAAAWGPPAIVVIRNRKSARARVFCWLRVALEKNRVSG